MRRLLAVCTLALALPALVQAATNPVIVATQRTAAAKTMSLQLAVTTTAAGQPSTVTGTGVQKGTSIRLSMRIRARGVTTRMDAILLREAGAYVMYMRSPVLQAQLPRGKTWLRIDLSRQAASIGVDFSSLMNTSQTFGPLEHGLVSTTRTGGEVVAGAATTRYRAVIDVRRVARAIPAYGRQVAAIERATRVRLGRTPYDVWIDGDRRIRRLRFSMPASGGGTTVQTMTFLAFDQPVTISAPPRSKVVSP